MARKAKMSEPTEVDMSVARWLFYIITDRTVSAAVVIEMASSDVEGQLDRVQTRSRGEQNCLDISTWRVRQSQGSRQLDYHLSVRVFLLPVSRSSGPPHLVSRSGRQERTAPIHRPKRGSISHSRLPAAQLPR